MDAHSTHPTAPVRSRSSQSPSHSASASASASATSSIHKRKLTADDHAPPFSADITSNDDLDSISARAGVPGSDSDDDSEEDAVVDDEEEDFDNESMRTFTTARLDNSATASAAVRNTKIKQENSTVKVEASEIGKDGGSSAAAPVGTTSVPAIVVKEDAAKIFTENMQTSGTYCAREESLKREEEAGRLKFVCLGNDGINQHMIWLIGLKNVFARQLPNMPKEYIVRLVMDRSHKSVMVIRCNQVVGGITYRPYVSQKFGEIAFCAITADEQVKGYGTRLMNHLKQYARDIDGLTHFLTYADNNAVGYFIKQGFTKEISLEKDRWQGYIKDYDGGILMECKIDPKLPYTDLSTMIRRQRQAIDEKIRQLSNCHIVYTGIDFQKSDIGIPRRIIKVEEIPGLKEAGWTPDQYGHSRFRTTSTSADRASNRKSLTLFMRSLLKLMHDHPDAWPFKEPVDARDVPDYYEIIKDPMVTSPMQSPRCWCNLVECWNPFCELLSFQAFSHPDLKTISKRVESEQYYITLEMFLADVRRMFNNAHTYNSPDTIYYKCATRLESFFSAKVQAGLQSTSKMQQ